MGNALVVLAALVAASLMRPAHAAERPTVVELFTSEGCSSCPPADALLAELATRPDVLALSYHVDYWNRLGWKDPFSSPQATHRQQRYARLLGLAAVYTPQVVVDGRWQAVGSDRRAVGRLLDQAQRRQPGVRLALAVDHGQARIEVGAGGGAAGASVLLISFDRHRVDTVTRGENAGRSLSHVDVVGGIDRIGRLTAGADELTASVPSHGDRVAAIVQAADGQILGAAVADAGRP
jgi:hypothetical protein